MSFSLRKGFTPKLHAVERLPVGFDVSVEYSIPSAYSTWFQFEFFFFFFLSEREYLGYSQLSLRGQKSNDAWGGISSSRLLYGMGEGGDIRDTTQIMVV